MTSTRKLKIWTVTTHAFIIVSFGHGIITLGLLEILWFPYFTKDGFTLNLKAPFETRIATVGFWTLVGQLSMIYSIISQKDATKRGFHLFSLFLLWLSIIYSSVNINNETNIHFSTFTAIPFLLCTIITFAAKPIIRFYRWALDE